eukprot:EG_transcript_14953
MARAVTCVVLVLSALVPPAAEAAVSCWNPDLCAPAPYCSSFRWTKLQCFDSPCYAETKKERVLRYLWRALEGFKGQDYVVEQVAGLLSLRMGEWDKPLNLHFAGDNGVGKTWLAKIVSMALSTRASTVFHGAGTNFLQVDLQRYSHLDKSADPSSLQAARADLLSQVRDFLRTCPRGVVLVDELEELHPQVATALAPILKGNPIGGVPTRSATFIMTSDFGREGAVRGLSREEVRREVYKFSADVYADPSLARYVTILPFDSMTLDSFRAVVEAKFRQLPCRLPQLRCVQWDADAAALVAEAAWEGLRDMNAREVDATFDSLVVVKVQKELDARSIRTPRSAWTDAEPRLFHVEATGEMLRKKLTIRVSNPSLGRDEL